MTNEPILNAMDYPAVANHQLNPDEPPYAVAVFAETTGDWNEFLFLTTDEGEGIAISPDEARALRRVIDRWLSTAVEPRP